MPTVPKSSNVIPMKGDMPMPSQEDFAMALGLMRQRGRLSDRLDDALQGEVEDRRMMSRGEDAAAQATSALARLDAREGKGRDVLRQRLSARTKFGGLARDLGEDDLASLGVSGGSR